MKTGTHTQGEKHAVPEMRGGSSLRPRHQKNERNNQASAEVQKRIMRLGVGDHRGGVNRSGENGTSTAKTTQLSLGINSRIPIGIQARLLAAIRCLQKAVIDPEKLRAKLHALYKKEFRREAREAIIEAIEAIRDLSGPVDAAEVELVMSTLSTRLGAENLGTTLVGKSTTIVRDIYRAAGGDITAGYKLSLIDHDAIRVLSEHDLVWIKNHFDDDLMPAFRNTVTEVMETGYSRRRLAERLADELGGVVDADMDYWESLADHTVTKARSMGRLAAIEEAGIEKIVIVAQMDGRTSRICRNMNGRIIEVAVARAQVDAVLAATDRDELKNAMMWPEYGQMPGRTSDLKNFAGDGKHFALPPYHYKCRTDYDAYFQGDAVTMEFGDDIRDDDRDMLDVYTADEHLNRAQAMIDQAHYHGLRWDDDDWKDDVKKALFAKHGAGEFGDDADRYFARSQETVMNADHITVRVYRSGRKGAVPRVQYTFYSKTNNALTVVDDNGMIRGCYMSEDIDLTVAGQARERLWLKRKND